MSKKLVRKGGKKGRKYGRTARKSAARSKPLSLYVRDRISFETYWKVVSLKK